MPPYLKRGIVTAWVVLAVGTVMYFVYRSGDPLIKLVVIGGGFAMLFIFIKVYLFRMK
jgi:hypothetical protein